MEHIQALFTNFEFAFPKWKVTEYVIEYTQLDYDEIDDDLDYDEEYYTKMMLEFNRWLQLYIQEALTTKKCATIQVVVNATINKKMANTTHELTVDGRNKTTIIR